MITLYGHNLSRANRCLWVLEELGIDYEQNKIDHRDGSTKTPEYLAINPSGKTPALRDGDVCMSESLGINLYIAQKYGGGSLWPNDDEGRAKSIQWTMWAATELEGPVITVVVERLFKPENARDEAAAKAAENKLPSVLNVLNTSLEGRNYLASGDFTIADLNVGCVVGSLKMVGFNFSIYPNVSKWLDGVLGRDAYQKVQAMPKP